MKNKVLSRIPSIVTRMSGFLAGFFYFLLSWNIACAETERAVQIVSGRLDPAEVSSYLVQNLRQGQTLSIYVEGTSGNLDPFAALADIEYDAQQGLETLQSHFTQVMESAEDPLSALRKFLDTQFLTWDEDSGKGYAAAFEFIVPQDGDYQLLIASDFINGSFGTYRLLVGIDSPEVLSGNADMMGKPFVIRNLQGVAPRKAIQEIRGKLKPGAAFSSLPLADIRAGETLYVFVEALSGDFVPEIHLQVLGSKLLSLSRASKDHPSEVNLQYTFQEDSSHYSLEISGTSGEQTAQTGEYRLLLGINAPEVLTGKAESAGPPIVQEPIEVSIAIKVDQITDVDQRAENFSVVANLWMRWQDPNLAFDPASCQCEFKTFTPETIKQLINTENTTWPAFTLFNQQGNRWSQNRMAMVFPDGQAVYFERFSTTLQAPNFNFRKYPFDVQEFFIRVDQVLPENFYVFRVLEDMNGFGEQLGEEEWIFTEFDTTVTSQKLYATPQSSFLFTFKAKRHLTFYLTRIFLPLLIILSISWLAFFLADFSKRVDIASGNLLLFVAFNFTIASFLPRLGYLTFLDMILISILLTTSLVLVANVYLKRLEMKGKTDLAHRFDPYLLWGFPSAYVLGCLIVVWKFFF